MMTKVFALALTSFLAFSSGLFAQTPMPTDTQSVVLNTPTGPIYGTLQLSSCKTNCPVALIIAGSGPTDRDGNSKVLPGPNNSLKMLAESLAANGISSVRYDKRGIAASAKSMTGEADLRFTNFVDDAANWIRFLRNDSRFGKITVIGHSEGSLIGMLAMHSANADSYVSISGTDRPAGTVILAQLSGQLPPELFAQSERIIGELNRGRAPDSIPPPLFSLFRASVIPYLISWFPLDPAKVIAGIKAPILIVQGTTDIQVGVEDAKLLAAAQPAAHLVLIEGMNHVLKDAPSDRAAQMKTYFDPSFPVNAQLIREIAAFIKSS